MAGNYDKMLEYYSVLIESAIDFKIESRKILAANLGKSTLTSTILYSVVTMK